jgi:hypothetical protein
MPDFHAIAESAVDELLELTPEEATSLGYHRFDDRVFDLSLAGADAAVRRLRARQVELERVDQGELDGESRVDLAVLANQLALRIYSYEEVRDPSWNPLAYNPGAGLFPLLTQTTQSADTRLRGVCGRLEATPRDRGAGAPPAGEPTPRPRRDRPPAAPWGQSPPAGRGGPPPGGGD